LVLAKPLESWTLCQIGETQIPTIWSVIFWLRHL
jgi:hypothetical protein